MWFNWLKLIATGLLAFAAVAGLAAVVHDGPNVYPVTVRTRWLTVAARASLRHVDLSGWRTADHDDRGVDPLYWDGPGVGVYTRSLYRAGERAQTDAMFATASRAGRVGEVGVALGSTVPPIGSNAEVLVPTWLAVAAGTVPFVVVAIRQARRRRRAMVGHCRRCGYDLRATRDRCPECGAAVPAAVA